MQPQVLQRVYGLKPSLAIAWAPHVQAALDLAEINTAQRAACFIAQVGHESGSLRYTREIWGPTTQQKRYEPITTLAGRLGNKRPGDGRRYMGRGLIQTTGRANYALTTVMLRRLGIACPDFEAEPQLLELPRWAALSAGLYWRAKQLNRFADAGDFAELTRRINGGYNGLAHRQALYTQALLVPDLELAIAANDGPMLQAA